MSEIKTPLEMVMVDVLIYGTGFLAVDMNGVISWIPIKKVCKTVRDIDKSLYESAKLKPEEL